MPIAAYKKGQDSLLDHDFAEAHQFSHVKLGTTHIFWRKALRWSCLPLSEVQRAYRRVEAVSAKTGCCSNDFSIHRLILLLNSGEELNILIGDSLYNDEPQKLIEAIRNICPEIAIGKPKE